uniref:Unconventional myosin-Ic-like n=2 Tax=Petromyzon marinus TaxID=7757 RepID=A0AAJ7SP66_PETMA|nr:unconventional myosin-Ic-like [Petromyzon marinus]
MYLEVVEGVRIDPSSRLTARDHVGVQDLILLEEFSSEEAFLHNISLRFASGLVYTYIGSVLISINPYKDLGLYGPEYINRYQGVHFYELPPHIYALSDHVYRAMRSEYRDQCILITGESGAGKTEASKKVLHFLSNICEASPSVDSLRNRLIHSNPILEAFGNALTLCNDNSSRFGKYMHIQFDFTGTPVGGHILNFLLEKSRVVLQHGGERNFHIFYQLLAGGRESLLDRLGLARDPARYRYLGEEAKISPLNDVENWRVLQEAFHAVGFDEPQIETLFDVIASVIHLGNTRYTTSPTGYALITDSTEIHVISKLLDISEETLESALTKKTISASGEEVVSPLGPVQAAHARDALAKAIYERAFSWLVGQLNNSLASKEGGRHAVIGFLDIYGFEVFQHNSFEQLCINYCNEKLQQLFITHTLGTEQVEYEAEGIEWESILYFDNKIICDLVEQKHKGILAILDEECLRPGEATDLSFLEKLEGRIGGHPHFLTHKLGDHKNRREIKRDEFQLRHYAGEVNYNVKGFLDKNQDLLLRNLKEVMCGAGNMIIKECFCPQELNEKKWPGTIGAQFKSSLGKLMEILMSKDPSYVRCIKPNNEKQADAFDDTVVRHQIKYLGLVESVRVRRAGFAYRRKYHFFLQRYKSLCPETWPHWRGLPAEGVTKLVKYIGYEPEDYKMGRTKIFIRHAKIVFATEEAFEKKKQILAAKIQARYKGHCQRVEFKKTRGAAVKLAARWKGHMVRKMIAKRKWAAEVIRNFVQGFRNRHKPRSEQNEEYFVGVRVMYLMYLKKNLPKSVLDKSWPEHPTALKETSDLLRKLCMRNMVFRYCKQLPSEHRCQLEQKLMASQIFKGQKDGFPQSIPTPFVDTRLSNSTINKVVLQAVGQERIKYACPVMKYDRRGFKPRPRQLLLTQGCVYIVEESKIKQTIPYTNLKDVSCSSLSDGFFILHMSSEDRRNKGDMILQSNYVFETLTKLALLANKTACVNIYSGSITFIGPQGKEGNVIFSTGPQHLVCKDKRGHLSVVVPKPS